MDMMILGETLVSAVENDAVQGFWMPAGGNNGVAAIEVFIVSDTSVFRVDLQTKSSDQTDVSAASIGNATILATGVEKFDVANAKDLVRYTLTRLSGEGEKYIHYQFCQPLWAPN